MKPIEKRVMWGTLAIVTACALMAGGTVYVREVQRKEDAARRYKDAYWAEIERVQAEERRESLKRDVERTDAYVAKMWASFDKLLASEQRGGVLRWFAATEVTNESVPRDLHRWANMREARKRIGVHMPWPRSRSSGADFDVFIPSTDTQECVERALLRVTFVDVLRDLGFTRILCETKPPQEWPLR